MCVYNLVSWVLKREHKEWRHGIAAISSYMNLGPSAMRCWLFSHNKQQVCGAAIMMRQDSVQIITILACCDSDWPNVAKAIRVPVVPIDSNFDSSLETDLFLCVYGGRYAMGPSGTVVLNVYVNINIYTSNTFSQFVCK